MTNRQSVRAAWRDVVCVLVFVNASAIAMGWTGASKNTLFMFWICSVCFCWALNNLYRAMNFHGVRPGEFDL